MEVTIRLHAVFKENIGTDTIRVSINDNETLDTLLMKISRRYPKLIEMILDPTTGELKEEFDILVNGRRVERMGGIHAKLKHKDEITMSPHVAEGGTAPV
ncbi:MAG: MoaD family protein [Candidatus Hadarchaeota archaeon]